MLIWLAVVLHFLTGPFIDLFLATVCFTKGNKIIWKDSIRTASPIVLLTGTDFFYAAASLNGGLWVWSESGRR